MHGGARGTERLCALEQDESVIDAESTAELDDWPPVSPDMARELTDAMGGSIGAFHA